MTTVTKRDLVVDLAHETGLTQQQVQKVVQHFLDEVTEQLADGNQVVLRNFGVFQVRRTKAKVGRNPTKPDTAVAIPERSIVKFKPGKELKERVATVLPHLAE